MHLNVKSKIAIVSHILPPSPSGQAMVLCRLLKGLKADSYCLISSGQVRGEDITPASARLGARHHCLKKILQLPVVKIFILANMIVIVNSIWGIYRRAKQIEKIVREEQGNLIISCSGDLYDLPAAYLASLRLGIAFVPYIFDDYVYQWTGIKRTIAKLLEKILLTNAKAIIVPNEFLQEEYEQRYGVKSTVIHNPCPLPDLNEMDRIRKVFADNDINIVYTGAIYHAHYDAFRNLITAVGRMERTDIKLHLYTAQLEAELRSNGIWGPMVVYHPHIPQTEVEKVLPQADILFLPLAFASPIPEVIRTSAPGKTGEYLAAGRPIIVHAPCDSFISWYFTKNQCGIVVDQAEPAAISCAISRIISDKNLTVKLGARARHQAEIDFDVSVMREKFLDVIR